MSTIPRATTWQRPGNAAANADPGPSALLDTSCRDAVETHFVTEGRYAARISSVLSTEPEEEPCR